MDVPKSFKTALSRKEEEQEKERLKESKEDMKYKKLCEKYHKLENSLLKSKVEICRKIFSWKNEFLKTNESVKIFKNSGSFCIFGGGWAHKLPRYGGPGCWSRIYINKKSIEYEAGYKWMPTGPVFNFNKPEGMAKKPDYAYLKKILNEIDNKNIFKNIIKMNL